MTTEVEFAKKYQELVTFVCPDQIPGVALTDLQKVPNFAFSELVNPPVYQRGQASDVAKVKVTFKSMRSPKFNKTVDIPSDWLIHKVKRTLQETLKEDGTVVDIEQIVLMVKTKTVHDGAKLSSLIPQDADTLALNVLITKAPKKDTQLIDDENDEMPDVVEAKTASAPPETVTLSAEGWSTIYGVLRQEIPDQAKRDEYFKKLKSVEL